jgi:hypothetical protein
VLQTQTVIAAAGRRIDDTRFPAKNEEAVAKAIRSALKESSPSLVVASAACGADILVLEAAMDLGIPTRIILPFSVHAFRERSVADCGTNWASRYDALVWGKQSGDGRLILLTSDSIVSDEKAAASYHHVTEKLFEEVAASLRRGEGRRGAALLVWDAVRKDEKDESGYFFDGAHARGWQILEVPTLLIE